MIAGIGRGPTPGPSLRRGYSPLTHWIAARRPGEQNWPRVEAPAPRGDNHEPVRTRREPVRRLRGPPAGRRSGRPGGTGGPIRPGHQAGGPDAATLATPAG